MTGSGDGEGFGCLPAEWLSAS